MSLVFAAIVPHGTLPEAPIPGADATHEALEELGRRFEAARPETTIVLTPHNVHIEGHFAVVLAGALAGRLAEFDAPEVELVQENRLGDLLELEPALVDAAKADSWWQLLMLHGALQDGWRGDFLSYEASTYFGMLCAAYAPN